MRAILWGCRLFIFLIVLVFAIKNTERVTVFFFFDMEWQAPLIFVLLASFAFGALFGLLSLLGTLFGLRREVSRLKRALREVKEKPVNGELFVEAEKGEACDRGLQPAEPNKPPCIP